MNCNHTFKFVGFEQGRLKYICVKCDHVIYEKPGWRW